MHDRVCRFVWVVLLSMSLPCSGSAYVVVAVCASSMSPATYLCDGVGRKSSDFAGVLLAVPGVALCPVSVWLGAASQEGSCGGPRESAPRHDFSPQGLQSGREVEPRQVLCGTRCDFLIRSATEVAFNMPPAC